MALKKAQKALEERRAELAALIAERDRNGFDLMHLRNLPTCDREAMGDWRKRERACITRNRELRAAVIAKQGEIKEAEYDFHLAEHGVERPT